MHEMLNHCPVCAGMKFSLFMTVRDHFLSREEFDIVQCEKCGFRFVNPRPLPEEIARYYQSEEYRSHDAQRGDLLSRIYRSARFFSIRFKYGIVRRYAKPGKILDLGCGTGEFLLFCRRNGYEVTGVEPNDTASAFARDINKIPVYQNFAEVNDEKGAFSCITMWHVLEHVHDLNGTLETIRKLLSPDGTLIVALPNCNSWDAAKYGEFWAAYDVPRHLYHFTAASLRTLMQKHFFEVRAMLPQRLDSFYITLLSRKYRTGSSSYLLALAQGFWSNLQAGMNNRGYSSQVFILTPKNP